MDNGSAAAYTQAVVTAVYNPPGTNDPDVVTSQTGCVFVAQTPEVFTYDDDGNLTRDGRFTYIWDAENRLISATTRDDLPASVPRVFVTHQYDHQSRRIAKARETWSGAAWQPAGTNRYVYDGWTVVAETRSASPANTNLYVWGLDLSEQSGAGLPRHSAPGASAGGVGGLLAEVKDGVAPLLPFDLSTMAGARQAIPVFGQKLNQLAAQRGQIGAFQSRLSVAVNVISASTENMAAASGRIMDADIAEESATLVRTQILQQAGAAVLSQANQQPALALELLKN